MYHRGKHTHLRQATHPERRLQRATRRAVAASAVGHKSEQHPDAVSIWPQSPARQSWHERREPLQPVLRLNTRVHIARVACCHCVPKTLASLPTTCAHDVVGLAKQRRRHESHTQHPVQSHRRDRPRRRAHSRCHLGGAHVSMWTLVAASHCSHCEHKTKNILELPDELERTLSAWPFRAAVDTPCKQEDQSGSIEQLHCSQTKSLPGLRTSPL